MLNSSGLSASDVALLNDRNGNGFFGGDGWWVIIIFALIFGWGGNGFGGFGGGNGAIQNYVLGSDFATIQRQLSDGFGGVEKGLDTIRNGLCDGFYTEAQLVNSVNTNILQSTNAIQSQLAQCCCDNKSAIADVNYNMAMNTNATQRAISDGFCQTNFNAQTNTRDIVDSQNANTRAILDKLSQMEANAKDEKIAELTAMNSDLRFQASQVAQNQYLVGQLRPCPIPAYQVANPYCNCGYVGNGYFGTTIA